MHCSIIVLQYCSASPGPAFSGASITLFPVHEMNIDNGKPNRGLCNLLTSLVLKLYRIWCFLYEFLKIVKTLHFMIFLLNMFLLYLKYESSQSCSWAAPWQWCSSSPGAPCSGEVGTLQQWEPGHLMRIHFKGEFFSMAWRSVGIFVLYFQVCLIYLVLAAKLKILTLSCKISQSIQFRQSLWGISCPKILVGHLHCLAGLSCGTSSASKLHNMS